MLHLPSTAGTSLNPNFGRTITWQYLERNRSEYLHRILYVLSQANSDDIRQGLQWYPKARSIAHDIGKAYGLTLKTVASIIAILSPGAKWSRNIQDTRNILDHEERAIVTTYQKNKIKALRVLWGEVPETVVSGDKTSRFYRNILGEKQPVTLDRHAARVACGIRLTADQGHKFICTERKYQVIESIYQESASYVGLVPSELQAITWCTYKRLYVKSRHN